MSKFTRTETAEHQNLSTVLKTAKKEKQIGARVDEDLFYEAQEFALKKRTSLKNVVEIALREYLDRNKV